MSKGTNIRVSTDVHKSVVEHIGKIKKIGAWTEEAIQEKIKKEQAEWPLKKETKA